MTGRNENFAIYPWNSNRLNLKKLSKNSMHFNVIKTWFTAVAISAKIQITKLMKLCLTRLVFCTHSLNHSYIRTRTHAHTKLHRAYTRLLQHCAKCICNKNQNENERIFRSVQTMLIHYNRYSIFHTVHTLSTPSLTLCTHTFSVLVSNIKYNNFLFI